MSTKSRLGSFVVVALMSLVPAAAAAEPATHPKHGMAHGKHDGHAFPMKADEFRKMVDEKIAHVRAKVDHAMDARKLTPAARAELTKAVDAAVKDVHGAVDKAAADGTVTKDEAKQVRELARTLATKVRADLGFERAKSKGKGQHRKHA